MCGIAGLLGAYGMRAQELDALAAKMSNALTHRGPDDQGVWSDENCGVALGHRRLSIIDLSDCGHQPMLSGCERFVTVFNGEIYNFKILRKELEKLGWSFRGHSDTEVLLAAIAEWGIEKAIQAFNGMFALAVWDRQARLLHLARDRMGEKPLYYGWAGNVFLFGSELKALKAYRGFHAEIDRDALTQYFRYKYVPCPYSIYRGIYKLPAASIVTVSLEQGGTIPEPVPYWSLQQIIQSRAANECSANELENINNFEQVLADAIEMRMVADVPLGAFLSGGIDSSTVVALMQSRSTHPVKTFSIGFNEAVYNEANYAKAVAHHLGTEHTELYLSAKQAIDVIPGLPQMYDEPFADSSQIPTHLVARLAREHVTVVLSGDGGDELLAGYWRHFMATRIWENSQGVPEILRQLSIRTINGLSPSTWDTLRAGIDFFLPKKLRNFALGDRLYKLASVIQARSENSLYRALVSDWVDCEQLVINGHEPLNNSSGKAVSDDFRETMMYYDAMTYLPDDILAKVDRATMAVSLEARVPFLDPNVIESAWQLPMDMKIRGGQGKWLLRQILSRYVPESLFDRPKMGFGVPIDSWLRSPLRDWAEEMLNEKRLNEQGLLNASMVRQCWQEHLSGRRNWQNHLWDILMFQSWYACWME